MLALYTITMIVGGVFVLLSALGGDHEHSHDGDFDKDFDTDIDTDIDDLDPDADGDAEVDAGLWIPFLSMRFWTYYLTFFGLTGLALGFADVGDVSRAGLAVGMGMATGLGMAYSTRWFKQSTTNSGVGVRDLRGTEAEVMFAVAKGDVGKIRCHIKGQDLEFVATTDEELPLERGSKVLILGFDGATARVVRLAFSDETADSAARLAAEIEALEQKESTDGERSSAPDKTVQDRSVQDRTIEKLENVDDVVEERGEP